MKLFRIITEDKNRDKIRKSVEVFYSGYTLISTAGYWKKQKENSLIIEIQDDDINKTFIYDIANWIKIDNDQDAVLVQEIDVNGGLV